NLVRHIDVWGTEWFLHISSTTDHISGGGRLTTALYTKQIFQEHGFVGSPQVRFHSQDNRLKGDPSGARRKGTGSVFRIWRELGMSSRTRIFAAVTLLASCFAGPVAWAQPTNLEAGKSASQLFAGTCN